jgi:hypothetical protein
MNMSAAPGWLTALLLAFRIVGGRLRGRGVPRPFT